MIVNFFLADSLPIAVTASAGSFFDGVPVVCGGNTETAVYSRQCYIYGNQTWTRVNFPWFSAH